MKGNNFFERHVVLAHILPLSVNNTTAAGAWIVEPWQKGRQLSFVLEGGAIGTASTGTAKVQGRLRGTSTAVTLFEPDGTTELQYDPAALSDTAAFEGGALLGTLDLTRISSETYDAVRLLYDNDVAVANLVSCIAIISDLYEHPSTQVDYLYERQVHG